MGSEKKKKPVFPLNWVKMTESRPVDVSVWRYCDIILPTQGLQVNEEVRSRSFVQMCVSRFCCGWVIWSLQSLFREYIPQITHHLLDAKKRHANHAWSKWSLRRGWNQLGKHPSFQKWRVTLNWDRGRFVEQLEFSSVSVEMAISTYVKYYTSGCNSSTAFACSGKQINNAFFIIKTLKI